MYELLAYDLVFAEFVSIGLFFFPHISFIFGFCVLCWCAEKRKEMKSLRELMFQLNLMIQLLGLLTFTFPS